ncbi:MAG: hypothetical protein ACOC0P_00760 [Planctomycetota bacterium]
MISLNNRTPQSNHRLSTGATSATAAACMLVATGVTVPSVLAESPGSTIQLELLGERPIEEGLADLLPSGRMLVLQGNKILREVAPGSGTFDEVGTVAEGLISSFGASFFSVSPDGTYIAFGDNNFGNGRVYVSLTAFLDGRTLPVIGIDLENFAADWLSPTQLGVAYGNPVTGLGEISIVEITFPLASTVVLENIGGASGGIGFDHAGNLYTGNGFDFIPDEGTETGDVKVFDATTVQDVLAGNRGAVDFETEGTGVADRLSAGGLVTDPAGNLFVGGGDNFGTSGDFNYFAVLNGDAVQDVINGVDVGPITDADTFTADPSLLTDETRYSAWYDDVAREWLIRSTDDATILYRYVVSRRIDDSDAIADAVTP